MSVLTRLHIRLGDFWWYSLMLFVACRCGDVINAFVGLWLVPKYVPQEELGAVLPLMQVTSLIGLPISILVVTFTKFLNKYQTCGESGKVKSLISMFWIWMVVAIFAGSGLSVVLLPHFFERIRVVPGALGILILVVSILGATAPVFSSALQALKRFKAISVMNFLSAPIRLIVMLVAMPVRPLSGYMVGQGAPSLMSIVLSVWSLRSELRHEIRPVPFWREDGRAMVRYTLFLTMSVGVPTIVNVLQGMVIRQRMPEVDSAAYYMISRFAELATYAGLSLNVILFPLAAESAVHKTQTDSFFWRAYLATIGFGLCCALFFYFLGPQLFSLTEVWACFSRYNVDLCVLSVAFTLGAAGGVFTTYETASGRFGFLWYVVPLTAFQGAFFVCFCGCQFFRGILPDSFVEFMASFRLCELRNFLSAYLILHLVGCLANLLQILLRRKSQMRLPRGSVSMS